MIYTFFHVLSTYSIYNPQEIEDCVYKRTIDIDIIEVEILPEWFSHPSSNKIKQIVYYFLFIMNFRK